MSIVIIMCVIAVALIPINLFLFNMPELSTIIASLLIIAALMLFFIRKKGGKLSKIIISIVSVLCICFTFLGSYCNPYWNSMLMKNYSVSNSYNEEVSFKKAKKDIDSMMHYLKKTHPLFINGLTDEIESRYDDAVKNLENADKIDTALVKREIQGIIAPLGDAHTCCFCFGNSHYLKYIYARNQENLKITKINGKSINEFLPLYSYEAEIWGKRQMANDLSTLEGLYSLGIDISNEVIYTYESESGEEKNFTYKSEDFITYDEYLLYNNIKSNEKSFVYYDIDEDKSIAVLTLTECKYNSEYKQCLNHMFTEIREKSIKNVAVDLRNNGGGNSLVVNEFIKYLDVNSYKNETSKQRFGWFELPSMNNTVKNKKYDSLTFDGNVFVMTSAGTFSSAMMFAEYIKDNNLGKIVGEMPGNAPTGYGDIAVFRLKNTGLYVQISTKSFVRADKDCKDKFIIPDIQCPEEEALDRICEI